MTSKQIMTELEAMGSESVRKILMKHGIREPLFGVKIEHLKTIQKKVKTDYILAKELFATGNADAMYLAGLIADNEKMTMADLNGWVRVALSRNISEYTVPWVAAEGKYGYEIALSWIDSPKEHIAAAGWATLAGVVALKEDSELDTKNLKSLLNRVSKEITKPDPRVSHAMNGFVIAVGAYVKSLTEDALAVAKKISTAGKILKEKEINLPDAGAYILKIKDKGHLGKKKKTVKC